MLIASSVLSIDPGNDAGAGILEDGRLQQCGLLQKDGKGTTAHGIDPWAWLQARALPAFDYLVIEIPRISKQTKNPASIITLSITAGRLIERYPHEKLLTVFVDEWKGSVEKREHNARVVDTLYDTERALLPALPAGLLHNVIDGVGIGLRATGRMLRGKARGR